MLIPFAAIRKLIAFVSSPSITNTVEALAALGEVIDWLRSVWNEFESQPKMAFASNGDCCVELETRLADLEQQPADVKMGVPSWLLPLILEIAKKLLEKLGK